MQPVRKFMAYIESVQSEQPTIEPLIVAKKLDSLGYQRPAVKTTGIDRSRDRFGLAKVETLVD